MNLGACDTVFSSEIKHLSCQLHKQNLNLLLRLGEYFAKVNSQALLHVLHNYKYCTYHLALKIDID